MKRKRHTPEQIIRKLREADGLLAEGNALGREPETVSSEDSHRGTAQVE